MVRSTSQRDEAGGVFSLVVGVRWDRPLSTFRGVHLPLASWHPVTGRVGDWASALVGCGVLVPGGNVMLRYGGRVFLGKRSALLGKNPFVGLLGDTPARIALLRYPAGCGETWFDIAI